MPAVYPPIAPRGPSSDSPANGAPSPSDSFNPRVPTVSRETSDDAGQGQRLAALERDPSTFVDAHHPIRDAVAIALLKPAGELIKRHAARQRMMKEAIKGPLDSDDPTERPMTLANDDGLPAILAMAETQVAMALLGDAKAFNAVADRVEGKAGLRKADLDAETEAQRQRVRGTIEELVREMGERRNAQRRAIDADVVDVDVVSRETLGRET